MKLSVVIITKNEEENIGRCLQSVAFADERIVVDAESTDRTIELAQEHGAHVITNPWPGYGQQKNIGLHHAHGEWVLFVDADEEVSPALAQEIQHVIYAPTVDFYWLKIVTYFLGKPLLHMYGHNLRLFRREKGQWTDSYVHEQVKNNASKEVLTLDSPLSAVLQEPLLHYSHTTISSYLESMYAYTTLDAQEMAKTNKHRSGRLVSPTFLLPYHLGIRQFLKLLFYRGGIQDGYAGFMWSILSGYYEFVMARKYITLKKNSL